MRRLLDRQRVRVQALQGVAVRGHQPDGLAVAPGVDAEGPAHIDRLGGDAVGVHALQRPPPLDPGQHDHPAGADGLHGVHHRADRDRRGASTIRSASNPWVTSATAVATVTPPSTSPSPSTTSAWVGAQVGRQVELGPVGRQARDDHRGRARLPGGDHAGQAALAAAQHQHDVADLGAGPADRPLEAGAEGVEQDSVLDRQVVGHPVQQRARPDQQVLAEAAPQPAADGRRRVAVDEALGAETSAGPARSWRTRGRRRRSRRRTGRRAPARTPAPPPVRSRRPARRARGPAPGGTPGRCYGAARPPYCSWSLPQIPLPSTRRSRWPTGTSGSVEELDLDPAVGDLDGGPGLHAASLEATGTLARFAASRRRGRARRPPRRRPPR